MFYNAQGALTGAVYHSFASAILAEAGTQVQLVVLDAGTVANTWAPSENIRDNVFSTGTTLTIDGRTVGEVRDLFLTATEGIRAHTIGTLVNIAHKAAPDWLQPDDPS